VSQSEGLLRGLTEFEFCKTHMRYGIGGNDKNYYMELYPECKLSRAAIRGKIDSDYKLRRAIHFTYEMCFMQAHWHHLEEEYYDLTPQGVYEKIKELGYDWNVLLETDGCWGYVEHEEHRERPFLSTMDVMNIALGKYHPFWMKEVPVGVTKAMAKQAEAA
jgi:hypothetical protein